MITMKTQPCILCNKSSSVEITQEEFDAYDASKDNNMSIQEIFPNKTPGERELFISGTHPECWEKMFSDFNELYEQDF